jgi:hypothetical protein
MKAVAEKKEIPAIERPSQLKIGQFKISGANTGGLSNKKVVLDENSMIALRQKL